MGRQPVRLGRFSGQAGGLQLRTNTAHPIKFTTYNDGPGSQFVAIPASMQILANASRDVEILAPLKVNSSLTTITNNVIMGVATSLTETALFVEAGGRFAGNLIVIGNLSVDGFYSLKPYVGIYVSSAGTVSSTIKPGLPFPPLLPND